MWRRVVTISIAQAIRAQRNKYLVLLILTDGAIHDMEDSIRSLVGASQLPLSVLFIGVGNDDFSSMEVGAGVKRDG